jgi:hypothetical protein
MKSLPNSIVAIVVSSLSAIFASAAFAGATVSYVDAKNFTDVPRNERDREIVERDITAHFDKLSSKLGKNETLKVEVLDIDLAGREEPRIGHTFDLRIVRGQADWPMMKFKYVLERDGKSVASGEARVADLNYTMGFNRYSSSEPLRYEKRMLDVWFRETFTEAPSKP